MQLIGRLATRLGASVMVAAAGLAVTAMPASAAPGVDLALAVKDGVVASGSAGKPFVLKVTNLGDTRSEGFVLDLDLAKVDTNKVVVTVPDDLKEFCKPLSGSKIQCEFGNALVRNDSLEVSVVVSPKAGASGAAGSFSATVTHDLDTNKANNSGTAQLAVSAGRGVDLVVWAEDVVAGRDEETNEAKRVLPGGTAPLHFGVGNGGSLAADGVTIRFSLPQDVTLVTVPAECTVAVRIVTCTLPDLVLQPNQFVEGELPVKVAANAPRSVELTGAFDGSSLGTAEPSGEDARRKASRVPSWARAVQGGFNPNEVDNRDNHDEFVVFVGAPADGGGGGLPVTGPKAIAIGGVGAAVLAVGVFLFVGARRRRVVLVTPAE